MDQWRTQEFFSGKGGSPGIFSGEVQQIQLKTVGRENGDLGAVAPWSGVPLNLKMSETRILIRLLRIYLPRISEFGSASEFRRGVEPTKLPPPLGTPLLSTSQTTTLQLTTPHHQVYRFGYQSGTHYCTPDDGYIGARNMLSQQISIFYRIYLVLCYIISLKVLQKILKNQFSLNPSSGSRIVEEDDSDADGLRDRQTDRLT
jgi:hypothetical protein